MNRRSGLARLLLLAVALSAVPAVAAEQWHTVVHGDSASAIAKRYYGDYDLADLLLRLNDRHDERILPGERLRVPYCSVHQVKPGDTGSTLAQRFLGRPSAWATIAEMNGMSPGDPLRVGQTIVMPVVLRHALARGESLAALAERYYADPSRDRLLQSFNRIEDPRELAIGRIVEIPLDTLLLAERSVAPKPAPEQPEQEVAVADPDPAPVEITPPTPAWFAEGLAAAESSYAVGDFDLAEERVAALLERIEAVTAPADRAGLWRLAAFLHVAFDREEDACAAFRSLRSMETSVELDPDLVSPKIRATLAACDRDGNS